MSAVWKLEKDLCRCCHSEGSFHNLLEPRLILGQEEYYLEMLRQSFDIELEPVPGVINEITFTICETCIIRLRDAANFKQQVLLCEKRFKDVYKDILKALTPSDKSTNIIKVEVEVPKSEGSSKLKALLQGDIKVEIDRSDDDDDDFHMQFDDEDNEPLFDLKKEDSKKPAPKAKKATTAAKKKPKPKSVCRQVKKTVPDEAQSAEAEAETADSGEQQKRGKYTNFTETRAADGSIDYKCNVCDKVFKARKLFAQHYAYLHDAVPRPQERMCYMCGVKVPSRLKAAHNEEVHGIPAPKCNVCNKKFSFESDMLKHQRETHMGEKHVECKECGLRFISASLLARHMPKHTGVRAYGCEYCDKKFKYKLNLRAHVDMHRNVRRHCCSQCGESFVQQSSLTYHVSKHHPELA